MTNIRNIIEPFFKDHLEPLIREAVCKALQQYLGTTSNTDDELLTAQESAAFIGDALQTFYGRTSKGEISTYGSGKRIFCKKSELIAWKEKQRTKSNDQLKVEVEAELKNSRRAK